jgi:hypothetical protein
MDNTDVLQSQLDFLLDLVDEVAQAHSYSDYA